MSQREGRFADDRLYYRAWDHPTPVAQVVIVHGFAEHSGRYLHVADAFVAAGAAVWALDLPGHGQSLGERADIGSVAAAVADVDLFVDLVEAAATGSPIVLVGHSMGGLVATAYAEAHQERLHALALSGPVLVVAPEILALADLDEIPDIGLADAISSDPAVVAAYKADPLVHNGPPPRGFLRTLGDVDVVREGIAGLTLPLLVMHGSSDLLAAPQATKEVVMRVASTDVTARIWPGLFHEIFNEPSRAEVLAFATDWLTAVLARPR